MSQVEWQEQKLCTDIGDYELVVEKQKRDWECEQTIESWKWQVVYHGSIIASGSVNDQEEAKQTAVANVPESAAETAKNCANHKDDE